MTLLPKIGSVVGSGTYAPGSPGGVGGPGGATSPGFNQATGQGTGWEITVLAAPDFHTLLALVPAKMVTGIQFVMQLDDKGSGTVTLDMDDPWWTAITLPNGQPGHYLLDWEHVWQVWQDGVLRFEFLGETVTEQLVDASEQRIVTVTGPGTIATLGWAAAMPPGFPEIVYKLDAITDGFSEINAQGQPVLDTGLWNASSASGLSLNPLGSCQIMGSSGTTFLGTTAYDATETLVSAQVAPIVSPASSGAVLDGSQLTQFYVQDLANGYYILIGMSAGALYAQYSGPSGTSTHTIASASAYAAAMSNNYAYQYWQISESGGWWYIYTSPDGQNWANQWEVFHTGWTPVNTGFYITAKYDVANTAYATVTSINSNVTTSSLAGALYFNAPIMSVWLAELQAAQARGTVPFVTTGQLTAATDSFGNPWTDSQSVQIANGTDLYSLLQGHASMINADYIMQPGFRLQVGIPESGSITLGTDRSGQVIFRDGMDCTSRVRTRTRNQIQNLLGVINTDGRTVTSSNATSASEYGQREGWVQAAAQVTQSDLQVVAAAASEQNATEVLSWTLQVAPYIPGRTVFTGFAVGDWVGLERPDFSAIDKVRVVAIAVQVNPDGSETHELTLVSYIQWLQEQLTYIATKLGGGFISANGTTAVADNGALTNLNQPTVFSPTLAGLGDVLSGGTAGGAPLVFDPVTGKWVPAGSVNPVTGSYTPLAISGPGGTTTVGGSSGGGVTVSQPPSTPPDVGSASTSPGTTVGIFQTTITDATGTTRTILGAQADGTVTTQDVNGPAPATPDTPTVTGTLNGIIVSWDGKLAGAAPLSDFLWVEVYVSTTSGFTPSGATLHGTLNTAANLPVTGLTAGTTYYAVLLARNTSGVASSASAQASGIATGLGASQVGNIGVLNINPYFSGGDGSTWAGVSGTFSVSSSPPSGSPYAYAGEFTVTTSGVGAAAKESGDPFPVTASQPYMATAWVNTPTTAAVIGFDWYSGPNGTGSLISSGTQSVTVTANTWTSVTTVQTAPSTAQSAWLRIAPADGAGNTIYFEAILALPQVPGPLIQLGSITSGQLSSSITSRSLGGITTTISATAPSSPLAGDIWINSSNGYQLEQYSGSAWTAISWTASDVITSGSVTTALLNSSVTARALGGITTTIAGSAPSSPTAGDIWINSSNGYQINQYSGSAWVAVSFTATDVISAGTISGALIEAATITGSLIAAGTITASNIAANTITASQIAAATITTSQIAAATILGSNIAAGTITAANISANTITAAQLAVGSLNINPYFAGGSSFGWTSAGGTLTVTGSPPAGAPFPYTASFVITSGTNDIAGSPEPFGCAASQNYQAEAWVYCSAAMTVKLGFGWEQSNSTFISDTTQSFSVSATTWTKLQTVQTSPSNAAYGYPYLSSTSSSGTLYATGVLVAAELQGGQIVPGTVTATQIAAATITGSLIAASTITATNIASGTITATQIASATITASQIAASTILGSNIAAGTITASNISSGTITSAQIAAGTITASNIASGTITAGLLSAGIVVAGIVNGTTIQSALFLATGTSGQVLAYSGTPASGNLINALAGASGTDSYGNSWPEGLYSQQLTLNDQASAPSAFSGASVFYSSVAGRPRYVSSAGDDSPLERSEINVAQFLVGGNTSLVTASAPLSYLSNEGNQSSEYSIEMTGSGSWATTSPQVLQVTFEVDSTQECTAYVGAASLPAGYNFYYVIEFILDIVTTGSSGTAYVHGQGVLTGSKSGVNDLPSTSVILGTDRGGTISFDTTSNHTLQIYACWTGSATGLQMTTYRTKLTRRM